MVIQRFTCRVPRSQAGQRLDLVTHEWLEAVLARRLSKSTIRRLVMAGAIRVDGRPTMRPGRCVMERERLDAVIDERRLLPATAPPQEAAGECGVKVLFEDEVLIAVAKPPGLQVHVAADPSRPDLFTLVKHYLAAPAGRAAHAPGAERRRRDAGPAARDAAGGPTPQRGAGIAPAELPYLGLHHRLDRDTSGVVLFVKAREANAGVAAQFEGHRVEKVYHALSARPARMPAAQWRVENQLAAVGKGHRSRMQAVEQDGERAATRFSVLERCPSALLVEARPETGRKHQIRAHLRECGLPILGDGRYEGPLCLGSRAVPRVMLHAARLVLQHPVTGKRLEILADYPDDFRALLAALRRK